MFGPGKDIAAALAVLTLIMTPTACAQESLAMTANANAIQPETTLSISAEGSVDREPDIAFLRAGVQTEADTAQAAIADNAARMNGVFSELKKAGVGDKDMQTSNFSLQPRYDYSSRDNRPPRLVGYTASNQLTVVVRDLENLGATMDALVGAGGNTFSGLTFALDDATAAQDEARSLAMKEATARAELYATAAGYKVDRIVSISESSGYSGPQPMEMAMSRMSADAAPTPIASGEVSYSATVNVVFELKK